MHETISRSSKLPEVLFIDRPTFEDERGFFREFLRLDQLEEAVGRSLRFVQTNHSRSKKGVLRGVHVANYDKLIYALRGEAFIALVDMRPGTASFGACDTFTIGDSRRTSVFVPAGFGNSFYVQSPELEYVYLVSEYYNPNNEKNIRWDDPDLAIPWPDRHPILSERDIAKSLSVREVYPEQFFSRS